MHRVQNTSRFVLGKKKKLEKRPSKGKNERLLRVAKEAFFDHFAKAVVRQNG